MLYVTILTVLIVTGTATMALWLHVCIGTSNNNGIYSLCVVRGSRLYCLPPKASKMANVNAFLLISFYIASDIT